MTRHSLLFSVDETKERVSAYVVVLDTTLTVPLTLCPALCGDDCICTRFRYGKYRRPRAGLCLDCYAVFFQRDGCAGIDRYRDRRAKERQGHGVAVFYGHALRVGSLSV